MAFLGGLLIGLSATLILAFNGRIAGISGILNHSLKFPSSDSLWRGTFLLGLVGGGWVSFWFNPLLFNNASTRGFFQIVTAGFLVGFGAVMAGGCTSGHGVCGLSRLSLRSFIAILIFILSGLACVGFIRWMGWNF